MFLALGILPFAAALVYALLYSFGMVGVLNEGFTWDYWLEVLQRGEFFTSFAYSALLASVSLFISLVGALGFCLALVSQAKSNKLPYVLYAPLAIPGVAAAFVIFQWFSNSGLVSRISHSLGITDGPSSFPDLVNDQLGIGIILTVVAVVLPFFLILFMKVYHNEQLNKLKEVATSLGASETHFIKRIALPVLLSKTRLVIALYFVFILGMYEIPLILGRETPQMLSVLIVREVRQYDLSRTSEGFVVAVLYTIFVSVIMLIFYRLNIRRVNEK